MVNLVKPDVYDNLYREEQFSKYKCMENLGFPARDLIIDVGCGTGLLYEYLSSKLMLSSIKYVCIDPDEEMLLIASKKMKTPFSILIQGYAEELSLRSHLGALVVSISTWGVIGGKQRALSSFKELAKPDGLVVVTGHPKTYEDPPFVLDPEYTYIGNCIDDFYIYPPAANLTPLKTQYYSRNPLD